MLQYHGSKGDRQGYLTKKAKQKMSKCDATGPAVLICGRSEDKILSFFSVGEGLIQTIMHGA